MPRIYVIRIGHTALLVLPRRFVLLWPIRYKRLCADQRLSIDCWLLLSIDSMIATLKYIY